MFAAVVIVLAGGCSSRFGFLEGTGSAGGGAMGDGAGGDGAGGDGAGSDGASGGDASGGADSRGEGAGADGNGADPTASDSFNGDTSGGSGDGTGSGDSTAQDRGAACTVTPNCTPPLVCTGGTCGAPGPAKLDFAGDGLDDLLIGVRNNDAGGSNAGAVYIVYGRMTPPASINVEDAPVTQLIGEGGGFGAAVAHAGDFNGDGYSDVVVGAFDAEIATRAGRVYVFFGDPMRPASRTAVAADLIVTGAAGRQIGQSVAGVGDVNGDGFDDVAFGAGSDWYGMYPDQEISVFFGTPTPMTGQFSSDADFIVRSVNEMDNMNAVAGAGDYDGDGLDDLIIGACRYPFVASAGPGGAFVFRGGTLSGSVTLAAADVTMLGTSNDDDFGVHVAGLFDFDGDGLDDVIVGADGVDPVAMDEGAVYLYLGEATPTASRPAAGADLVIYGSAATEIGYVVYGSPDLNGDTRDDLVVIAPYTDNMGFNSGTAHVMFGRTIFPAIPQDVDAFTDVLIQGDGTSQLGIEGARGLNFDAVAGNDLFVTDENDDTRNSNSGAAFGFFGALVSTPRLTSTPDVRILGENVANERLGNLGR